jgi:hypothetical protein
VFRASRLPSVSCPPFLNLPSSLPTRFSLEPPVSFQHTHLYPASHYGARFVLLPHATGALTLPLRNLFSSQPLSSRASSRAAFAAFYLFYPPSAAVSPFHLSTYCIYYIQIDAIFRGDVVGCRFADRDVHKIAFDGQPARFRQRFLAASSKAWRRKVLSVCWLGDSGIPNLHRALP